MKFHHVYHNFTDTGTAAVAQWVIALAPQAECCVFQSQPQVVKRGSDSSTAKRSAKCVSVTGSSEMTIINGSPVSQWVWQAKKPSLLNGHNCRL